MNYVTFDSDAVAPFSTAILIKEGDLSRTEMDKNYVQRLVELGAKSSDIVAMSLKYYDNTITKDQAIGYLENNIINMCERMKVKVIIVADSKYFFHLTSKTSSKSIGRYVPSILGEFMCIPVVNYRSFYYLPANIAKVEVSFSAYMSAIKGTPSTLGSTVIQNYVIPHKVEHIKKELNDLLSYKTLSVDIEAFSLNFKEAGIGTIALSKSKHDSTAFKVAYTKIGVRDEKKGRVEDIYLLLKNFFVTYEGKLIFHRGNYDVTILIYELFMDAISDYKGMVQGIRAFKGKLEDTLVLVYCCTNNTGRNVLNLKDNTVEYTGQYALDVKDITVHEPDDLLRYNTIDACGTFYLMEKYWDRLKDSGSYDIYRLLVDTELVLIQCELCGLPINHEEVNLLYNKVEKQIEDIKQNVRIRPSVNEYTYNIKLAKLKEDNLGKTTKVNTLADYSHIEFNVGSSLQLAGLLFNYLEVEGVDKTPKGSYSTGVDSLVAAKNKLLNKGEK